MSKYCSICTKALTSNNTYNIPCDHVFHKECITKWISIVGNAINSNLFFTV